MAIFTKRSKIGRDGLSAETMTKGARLIAAAHSETKINNKEKNAR